jgi:putative peptidoglycan lipid II flippase
MIINRVFYAFKNVRTPLKVASISILVNFLLDWILIRFMGVSGLALSTTLVALFNVAVLLFILRRKVGNLGAVRIAGSYWKILVSTAIMGGAVYYMWKYISVYAYSSLYWLIFGIFGVIVLGAGIYIGLTIIFRMDEIRFVLNMFRGMKNRPGREDTENNSGGPGKESNGDGSRTGYGNGDINNGTVDEAEDGNGSDENNG